MICGFALSGGIKVMPVCSNRGLVAVISVDSGKLAGSFARICDNSLNMEMGALGAALGLAPLAVGLVTRLPPRLFANLCGTHRVVGVLWAEHWLEYIALAGRISFYLTIDKSNIQERRYS